VTTDASSSRPLALVTGASSGIGLELARQFAEHGYDLIITADDARVTDAAAQLQTLDARIVPVQVDLTSEQGVDEPIAHVRSADRPLDAAALNAGVGRGGAFVDNPLEDELRIVDLNVRSSIQLAKPLVREMVARRHGRILFTSSIASTMPGPYAAVYNASKSFVQSFAIALRDELRGSGVTVTSLMPGPTETAFFERAVMTRTNLGKGPKDDPADVARMGYEAMMQGRERVVASSLRSKVQGRSGRLLPDSLKAALHRWQAKPR
jgi:short-subunit dehydrogenase